MSGTTSPNPSSTASQLASLSEGGCRQSNGGAHESRCAHFPCRHHLSMRVTGSFQPCPPDQAAGPAFAGKPPALRTCGPFTEQGGEEPCHHGRRTARWWPNQGTAIPGRIPPLMVAGRRRCRNVPPLLLEAWTERVSSPYSAPGSIPLKPACWPPMIESEVTAFMNDMRSRAGCGLR